MADTINTTIYKLSDIAGRAALSVNGVASLENAPISLNLRVKEYRKGVMMSAKKDSLIFDIYINVVFGCRIPEVAFKVQEVVKKAVEKACNKQVLKVNIHIQGIEN